MAAAWGWLTRHRRAVLVAAVLAVSAWWFSAYPRGVTAAWVDAARGHDEIQAYGYPEPKRFESARLLRERYGVHTNTVAGCVVTYELRWYVSGYNSVSIPNINARHGKDVFEECYEEAFVAWRRDQPRE
ncbi:hypothetical protein J0H58_00210 [bacterium]|nr:hypothetical protein [bacterium]